MEQLKGSVEAKKRLPQNGEAQDSLKKEVGSEVFLCEPQSILKGLCFRVSLVR